MAKTGKENQTNSLLKDYKTILVIKMDREFPGGPVVKTLSFQYKGHRFSTQLET